MKVVGDKLSYFKSLYEAAKTQMQALYSDLDKWYAQYKGSKEIDGSHMEASYVRNITYELIESQITGYIPTPSVTPESASDRNERNAKAIETFARNKRDKLNFEALNDMDERHCYIYGGSVWLVEWDDTITTATTTGEIKVSCLSPRHFCGQPGIFDINEMDYCFVTFDTTREDLVRKYGITPEEATETESEAANATEDENTATLYVCYYKDENSNICQYAWSGDVELLDEPDYYGRKRKVCKNCGKDEAHCTCEKPKFETLNQEEETLTRDIVLSDGSILPAMSVEIKDGMPVFDTVRQPLREQNGAVVMEMEGGVYMPVMADVQVPKMIPTTIPFYKIDVYPIVIRKNTSEEDKLFGQSDCEFIRPQQQAINKIESRIINKLVRAGVYPIVPDTYNGDLSEGILEDVIRVARDEVSLFNRLDLQTDISRDVAEADRLYDQAKRILGITDAYQGQYDASAQSGKAKQIQVQQAAGRLDSKRQMKNFAYSQLDEIIFKYYLAYADEPRPAFYRDPMGRAQNLTFNRYDFVQRDDAGNYYYDDAYLFRTDASVDIDREREQLWQINLQNYQAGTYGMPQDPRTLLMFWQTMERMHYPFASDNVERIKILIAEQAQMSRLQAENAALAGEANNLATYAGTLKAQIDGGTV